MENNKQNKSEQKLYDTIRKDISEGGFKNTISRDFSELKEFFINEERKTKLKDMNKVKRFFAIIWWLLKELLLKLTPTRRILLLISIFFMVSNLKCGVNTSDTQYTTDTGIFGGIIILFILMLELKDKLLAKDELNAGKSVQNALMHQQAPIIKGWKVWLFTQSANDVGGDLVDIINLKGNKYGITLGDVSGKGLGAALLMAKLQTLIRALANDFTSLNDFAEKLNRVFYKDILPNSFASMVYFVINENSKNVEMFNAGHLPPVILKGNNIEILPKGNVALGLAFDSKYSSNMIELEKDESIIAFSDGLTEARNLNGTFFGTERIYQILKKSFLLTPEQIGERLLNNVQAFIGEEKKYDDLSIVIIKREE